MLISCNGSEYGHSPPLVQCPHAPYFRGIAPFEAAQTGPTTNGRANISQIISSAVSNKHRIRYVTFLFFVFWFCWLLNFMVHLPVRKIDAPYPYRSGFEPTSLRRGNMTKFKQTSIKARGWLSGRGNHYQWPVYVDCQMRRISRFRSSS